MNEQLIRILLIEDDEDDYIIIKDTFNQIQMWTCQIDWAANAGSAISKLTSGRHDVCLLDYRLGEMNGIEFLDSLRKINADIPVIMLTGYGDHKTDLEAMQHGAVDYLEKATLNPVLLERTVRYAINTSNIVNALKKSEEKLKILSGRIIEAQEEERKTLALELHDSIGSGLAGVLFALERKIENFKSPLETKENTLSLEGIREMIKDIIDETQRISSNLRPSTLDSLGLLPAIRSLCKKFRNIYKDIDLHIMLDIREDDIPEKFKIIIYRIIQEAFNNSAKYSEASNLKLHLNRQEGSLILVIGDDGKGFNLKNLFNDDTQSGSIGLEGMIERAELSGGTLKIHTEEGKGTTIKASFATL
ncbi:MAG: response regulator [Deltaproteobacteria bacterium]|nr:response regulator [Deltaproteobacteria bacterium]